MSKSLDSGTSFSASKKSVHGLFRKAILWQMALSSLFLGLVGFQLRSQLRDRFLGDQQKMVEVLLQSLVTQSSRDFAQDSQLKFCEDWKKLSMRVSLIRSTTGEVLCDNFYPVKDLPLILERPEVQQALGSPEGRGASLRASQSNRGLPRIYVAQKLSELDLILRVGLSVEQVEKDLDRFDQMFWGSAVALLALLSLVILIINRGFLYEQTQKQVDFLKQEMQKNLLALVTHEFRTPLTSILGFTESLQRDTDKGSPLQTEHLKIVQKESERLLLLVNDLLDEAAAEAGALKLEKLWSSTRQISEDVLNALSGIYGPRAAAVELNFEVEEVFADPQRLHQVLVNLIGNSLKHGSNKTQVHVSWKLQNSQVIIQVEDNNSPPADEQKKNLFQKFQSNWSLQKSSESAEKRSGLGLMIAKSLIDAHGGSVELKDTSSLGGYHWILRLPQSPDLIQS